MAEPAPDWVLAALPPRWRAHTHLASGPRRAGELSLAFALPGQGLYTIDFYLLGPGKRALTQRERVGVGYRGDAPRSGEVCRFVGGRLFEHAWAPLCAYLDEAVPDPAADHDPPPEAPREPPAAGAHHYVDEFEIAAGRKRSLPLVPAAVTTVELFFAARCQQSCSFCVYPKVRGTRWDPGVDADSVARVAALLDALRPRRGELVLSGPDCLAHPQLDEILDLLAREREVAVSFVGPMTRLAEPELAARVLSLPTIRGVRTSLLSAEPAAHDRIVGRPGAHAMVLAALDHCRARGVPVMVSTVITAENVDGLPALLELLRTRELASHMTLYHPESWAGTPLTWREVELERVVVDGPRLRAALAAVEPEQIGHARARLIPHCWLPPRLWDAFVRPAADVQDNFTYVPGCEGCSRRAAGCAGVPRPAVELLGPDCVTKI